MAVTVGTMHQINQALAAKGLKMRAKMMSEANFGDSKGTM